MDKKTSAQLDSFFELMKKLSKKIAVSELTSKKAITDHARNFNLPFPKIENTSVQIITDSGKLFKISFKGNTGKAVAMKKTDPTQRGSYCKVYRVAGPNGQYYTYVACRSVPK
jgi:hypothetical protein